jgi:hypothetical protein
VRNNKSISEKESMKLKFQEVKASIFYIYFFSGLESVGHSFAYAAHFVLLRDVWIRIQRAAAANRQLSN